MPNDRIAVVFSGHRNLPHGADEAIRRGIRREMDTADEIIIGGAIGADYIALDEAWKCKSEAMVATPDSKAAVCEITIIVAARVENQPGQARDQLLEHRRVANPIQIIELGLEYVPANLLHRNRVMLDRAKAAGNPKLLMYWTGEKPSGTWSAYAYARKLKIPVENIGLGKLLPDPSQGSFDF